MSRSQQPSDGDDQDEKILLSKRDAQDAARLFQLLSSAIAEPGPGPSRASPANHVRLLERAKAILASRQLRYQHFSRAMFGEPAWDVLLLLYVHERDGERQTPTKLAAWSGTPLSTTVRWIDYLQKKQLVERHGHPNDKRIVFIALRKAAREAIEAYLAALPDPAS